MTKPRFRLRNPDLSRGGVLVPLLVFALGVAATLGFYEALHARENVAAKAAVAESARSICDLIDQHTTANMLSIRRMAQRWDDAGGTPRDQWHKDAANYVGQIPGLRILEWVDSTGHIRWTQAVPGNRDVTGYDLTAKSADATALKRARASNDIVLGNAAGLVEGFTGFRIFAPVHRDGKFDGYMVGAFDSAAYASSVLSPEIRSRSSISISQDGHDVFRHVLPTSDERPDVAVSQSIKFHGQSWLVTVIPSRQFVGVGSGISAIVLGAGIVISALLSVAVFGFYLARRVAIRSGLSESRYDLAVRSMSVGLWDWDITTNDLFWSQRFRDILGIVDASFAPVYDDFASRLHPDDSEATEQALADSVASKTPYDIEYRLRRNDGQYVWLHAFGQAQWDPSGRPLRMVGSIDDISERKTAEAALVANEARYRLLTENIPAMIAYWDKDQRCRFANRAYLEWFGRAPEDLIGVSMLELLGEELYAKNLSYIQGALDGVKQRFERTLVKPSGEVGYVWAEYLPDRATDGDQHGFYVVVTDITAVKNKDHDLAEANILNKAVLQSTRYLLVATDIDGNVDIFNAAAEAALGYSAEEIVGKATPAIWHDLDELISRTEILNAELGTTLEPGFKAFVLKADMFGHDEGEWTLIRKDGSRFPAILNVTPIKGPDGQTTGYLGVLEDIAERRLTEEKHRLLIDGVTDYAIYWLDTEGRVCSWNRGAELLKGYLKEEIIGLHFSIFFTEEDRREGLPERALEIAAKEGKFETEGWRVRKDGSRFWSHVLLEPMRDADGNIVGYAKISHDETSRREREMALKVSQQALANSEETFRSALENASIGMGLVAPDGRWLKVNKALTDLLGYAAEELLANDFQSITHHDDFAADLDHFHRALNGEMESYVLEKRFYHRDGRLVWTMLSASLVRNHEGEPRHFIVQVQDISERRELDRMKTEFISIVSHELRTPLTSIRGSLGLMLGTMTDEMSQEATEFAALAYNNCERLIGLINDILDIDKIAAGQMRFDIAEASIKDLVEEAVAANQAYAAKYDVRIVTRSLPLNTRISVDSARFFQVLTNLVSNAAKFSPAGADIDVAISMGSGWVRVNVIDRGPGIPEEFRSRIFGKFAQADSGITRSKGGTGLGLHVAREMVLKMKGNIGFDSDVGKGSTFWMEFPVVDHAATDSAAPDVLQLAPSIRLLLFSVDQQAPMEIGRKLDAGGMAFDLCRDFAEASKCIAGKRYDAIVVDLSSASPALYKALEKLSNTKLPIILVGAGSNLDGRARSVADKLGLSLVSDDGIDLPAAIRRDLLLRTDRPRILHIEDDVDFCAVIRGSLGDQANVTCVYDLQSAEAMLRNCAFDLIILDLCLPDAVDIDWARYITERHDHLPPIITLSADTPSPALRQVTVANLMKSKISERKIVEAVMKAAERKELQHG